MIVAQAKKPKKDVGNDGELTGAYLREQIIPTVMHTTRVVRTLNEADMRNIENNALLSNFRQYEEDFSRNCRGMYAAGFKIADLMNKWPKGLPIPVSNEFQDAVELAEKGIREIRKQVLA